MNPTILSLPVESADVFVMLVNDGMSLYEAGLSLDISVMDIALDPPRSLYILNNIENARVAYELATWLNDWLFDGLDVIGNGRARAALDQLLDELTDGW